MRGIIPARAGFTDGWRGAGPRPEDHPRSRGVYCAGDVRACQRAGSSPLARGLPQQGWADVGGTGIIPARAGFTPPWAGRPCPRKDHPRSRGVYRAWSGARTGPAGSSPLARGLREPAGGLLGIPRIIPARAGFTPSTTGPGRPGTDHPRSRGVYAASRRSRSRPAGSSPLARGLHQGMTDVHRAARIIPARAGFTSASRPHTWRSSDHPRSRGVYNRMTEPYYEDEGSSPLARGLPVGARGRRGPARIIPARAGFTRGHHPRRRARLGSSPLARGLLPAPPPHGAGDGIIPARAGFT